jgi:ABC-type transport system involved in cytochrome c biogenesis permease subunit
MSSVTFYNICMMGYILALALYAANLAARKATLRRVATVTAAVSFLSQTMGLVLRWAEAGEVEVAAVERAQDVQLTGQAWFVIYSQHPPWSNLYEIMVFMAWGIVLVYLVSEVKWRIRFAGIFALLLALTSLLLASGTSDATIKPLVPALQSWWIMIHVISSAIGYAAGTLGAVLSLLYLVKARDRVGLNAVGGGTLLVSAFVLLVLGRGFELFKTGAYKVKLLGNSPTNGELEPVGRVIDGSFHPFFVPSPMVGTLLVASVVLCFVAAVFLLVRRSENGGNPEGLNRIVYFVAMGATLATVAMIVVNAVTQTDFQMPAEQRSLLTHGAPPPWRLHFRSNQWDLALFAVIAGAQLFVATAIAMPERMRTLLPQARLLDRAAYYTILIAFALVAVVLVTGALWAHYAWGRYWGWDPKEVGALVIWITYALYLHARVTYGWVGVPSAVIAVLGFFVIIAGFLGVNLGWFADGLHSYGSA